MSLLIRNASYLVQDAHRVMRQADLLIEGNRIIKVGKFERPLSPDLEVIDAQGRAVIPGLINAHTHLYQNFLKGLQDNVPLVDWCDRVLFPMNEAIRSSSNDWAAYHWAMLGAMEMIRAGITCCLDMDMLSDGVFRAWQDIGFRGVGAFTLANQWLPPQLILPEEEAKGRVLDYVRRWHGHPRLQVALAPSTAFLCSEELLGWAAEQVETLGIGLQIHLAETRWEIEYMLETTGLRPAAYLERLSLLREGVSAVHCVHLNEEEIGLLKERGVIPVHCPKSNLKLGSGIAPVASFLQADLPVALGNDGCASNDILDMFEEMRVAALVPKGVAEDPAIVSAAQVFHMATQGGARTCGIEAGTLDEGKLADVVIVNLDRPHLIPVHDVIKTLVYCTRADDVETVIIDGRVVMQERHITTVAEDEVLDQARAMGEELFRRSLSSVLQPRPQEEDR